MPDGATATEDGDLGGSYYTAATPIVKRQIAKAGYRYVVQRAAINIFEY